MSLYGVCRSVSQRSIDIALLWSCHEDPADPLLTVRALLENFSFHPAGVVSSVQRIAREFAPFLPPIELVIHAMEGKRFDLCAGGHVKIGILVPTINVKEEFADGSLRLWRQRIGREFEGQCISRIY